MGDILSCVSAVSDVADIAGAAGDSPISPETLAKITEIAIQQTADFADVFQESKEMIVWEMWNAKPEPYEDEQFKESLTWEKSSEGDINALALKYAAGEELKAAVEDAIHEVIDPIVEEEAGAAAPLAQVAADKAIEAAAAKAIETALEKMSEEVKNNPDKYKCKTPSGSKPSVKKFANKKAKSDKKGKSGSKKAKK